MLKKTKRNNKRGTRRGGYSQSKRGYTSIQKVRFTGLDPQMYITFKYYQTFTFTNATTVAQNQEFRLNSLYDPDVTGGGHQPYLYDFMVDKYNRYLVLKTKWKVTFTPGAYSMHVSVIPSNGALPVAVTNQATFEAAAEIPFAKNNIISGPGGTPAIHINGSINLNVLNGVTPEVYRSDDRFSSVISTSPTEVLRLNVLTYNSNASSNAVLCSVQMEFESMLFDPIVVAQSSLERSRIISNVRRIPEKDLVLLEKLLSSFSE
jgi:hypothetical protein